MLGKYYIDKLPGWTRKMPRPPGSNSHCYKSISTSDSILPVHPFSAISSQASVEVAATTLGLLDSAFGPLWNVAYFTFRNKNSGSHSSVSLGRLLSSFHFKDISYEKTKAFAANLHIGTKWACCHSVPECALKIYSDMWNMVMTAGQTNLLCC